MQICYKTEGLTHYFVVLPKQPVRSSYESRLFSDANIPGFLPLELREMNGRQALYYRMDYRVSMREASGHLKVSYGKLKRMTGDLIAAMETAEAYLLEPECILWRTDAIFMDPESGRLRFCYVPTGEMEGLAAQEGQPGFAEETEGFVAQKGQPGFVEETESFAAQKEQIKFTEEAESGQKGQGRFKKYELPELLQEAAVALLQMADRRDGESVQWGRRFYDLVTGDCTLEQLIRFQKGEVKMEMHLSVEPEEPYVVQELPFQETQEAKENSRFEKIVKYGMAASAIWSAVVLVGLLTGLAPDAWVSGLMGGLAVLIVLSLLSMQLYREDSPEEIMRDYFSGDMSGGYGVWNGQVKQDRFKDPKGIKIREAGRSEPAEIKMRQAGFAEPAEIKMREAAFADSEKILRKQNRYEEAGVTANPYPDSYLEAEEVMGLEDLSIDKSARQMADRTQGQTVLLQREMPGQEKAGSLYLQSVERGKYPDVLAGDRGTVLGCLEDACDYILKERGVSRMHAKLLHRENGLYLIDLNSTNGTWINGARVESGKEYPLSEGDLVAFARCEFVAVRS